MGQGASTALPIWAFYMTKVYRDKALGYDPKAEFYTDNSNSSQTPSQTESEPSKKKDSPTSEGNIQQPKAATTNKEKEKNNGRDYISINKLHPMSDN